MEWAPHVDVSGIRTATVGNATVFCNMALLRSPLLTPRHCNQLELASGICTCSDGMVDSKAIPVF